MQALTATTTWWKKAKAWLLARRARGRWTARDADEMLPDTCLPRVGRWWHFSYEPHIFKCSFTRCGLATLRWELIKENKKKRKKNSTKKAIKKKRKQELDQESDQEKKVFFLFSWSLSWSSSFFFVFLIAFLVEFLFSFYKFPPH